VSEITRVILTLKVKELPIELMIFLSIGSCSSWSVKEKDNTA
jgi:hypothetical protein